MPMYRFIVLFLLIVVHSIGHSQNILINETGSSDRFIEILKASKDLKYNEIIEEYNSYINLHPNDITSQVERCKFIGNADYDAYEDYYPNYDAMIECIDNLVNLFPDEPEVLLYKIDFTWAEERISLIGNAIMAIELNKEKWSYNQQARLYEMASNYHLEDNDDLAIMYGEKAERLSDSLDLSIQLSEAYSRLGNDKKAKDVIMNALYYDSENAWNLKRKGDLLIKFNEIDEATKMFERATKKDSTLTNNESLYTILVEQNELEHARSYLVKDTINDWNKVSSIQKLLNHDIAYSSFDTAIISYRRMQELSYYDDFLGIKRLRLSIKSPFQFWTLNELSHLLWLTLVIAILFFIPYLWVLPIYSFKKFFNIKLKNPLIKVDWNLKHFWLISFAYLFAQAALILCFYYQDFINGYLEVAYDYGSEFIEESSIVTANANLSYFIFMLVLTLLFLNRRRLEFVFNTTFGIGKIIGLTFGFVFVNAIFAKISTSLFSSDELLSLLPILNSRAEIGAILSEYGFIVAFIGVAVIVPFYEEIIFRGIILSSVEKHVGFIIANLFQSILFAFIHMNFELFLFYLSFGFITGYMVKKSEGLLVGYIFHLVNNTIVLISMSLLASFQ